MWPWGHVALGYLLYSPFARQRGGRPPTTSAVVAVGVGTLLPDLVDKPLAWSVAVLPNGRSLAHSAFALVVLVGLAWLLATRWRPRRRVPVAAFAIGYGSHLLGDGLHAVVTAQFDDLAYLLWPVLPPVEYPTTQSFAAHFAQLSLTPSLGFELALTALAILVWYRDGTPGLALTRRVVPVRSR
jgi:membrane-bound metal-dependent hydrolase YbcI (DUF457 family)